MTIKLYFNLNHLGGYASVQSTHRSGALRTGTVITFRKSKNRNNFAFSNLD